MTIEGELSDNPQGDEGEPPPPPPQKKNVTKSGKSPRWDGESAPKIQNSTMQNVDNFMEGGGPNFQIFPKSND